MLHRLPVEGAILLAPEYSRQPIQAQRRPARSSVETESPVLRSWSASPALRWEQRGTPGGDLSVVACGDVYRRPHFV